MERLSNANRDSLLSWEPGFRAGWDMLTADVSLPVAVSRCLPGTASRIEGSIRRQIMKRMIFGLAALALVVSVLAGSARRLRPLISGTTWRTLLAPAMPMRRDNRSSTTAWARAASTPRCRFRPARPWRDVYLPRTKRRGVEREICEDTASDQGTFMCNAQDVLPDGFGLVRAVVRDFAGDEAAVGLFDRRGNCRVPNQAGFQCEAPGHQH